MQGRYKESMKAAEECRDALAPLAVEIPGFEGPLTAAMLVPVRFRDWDRVLKTPEPSTKQLTLHNLWHFGRGMAYAAKGEIDKAASERDQFRKGIAGIPEERTFGTNSERTVMRLPMFLLEAKIAFARKDIAPGDRTS